MNYFKETLPDGCTFNYETRLSKHLESLQMTNLINNDENIDEMNMRKQTVINHLNQIKASPIKSVKNYAYLINYNYLTITFIIYTLICINH